MELRHLRYFVAAAQEVNFGRAAERLRISGPALGQQIKELERELGVELFERLPRGVRLTTAGSALLADAQRILGDLQDAVAHAQLIGRGEGGTLHIGQHAQDSFFRGAKVGSQLIPAFCIRYPNVDVESLQMIPVDLWAALGDGRIDVAVGYCPVEPPAHCTSEVLDENFITGAFIPAAHPLARKLRVDCRDLSVLPCLAGSRGAGHAFGGMLVSELRARGLEVQSVERAITDLSVLIGLVALGAGWVPGNGSQALLDSRDVVFREWTESPIPFPRCVIWRQNDRSPLVAKFVSLAVELRDRAKSDIQSPAVVRIDRVTRPAR